jgi:hypothetical protein
MWLDSTTEQEHRGAAGELSPLIYDDLRRLAAQKARPRADITE